MKILHLTQLIDVNILQQIQDGFSEFTGMAALTTDAEGIPVTKGSGFTDFCTNLVRTSTVGCKRCEECDRKGAIQTMDTQKPSIYMCHAGLMDFAAPILLEGRMIGSFIGGQVRPTDLDEEFMRKKAEELDIDPDAYVAAAKETYILSMEQVEKAAVYLSELAQVLSAMAYQNFVKLQESRRLEKAARAQSKFITNLSMTMKNQLESWLATMEAAVASNDSQTIRDTLHRLSTNGIAVVDNMEETLDYVQLTSGKLELLESAYNVRFMLEQIVQNVKKYLRKQGSDMQVLLSIDEEVPQILLGDSGRIGQVINKMLRVGIEYAIGGNIMIEASVKRHAYAVELVLHVWTESTSLQPVQIDRMRKYMKTERIDPVVEGHSAYVGLSSVVLMVKQLTGRIEIPEDLDAGLAAVVSFPQLEVKGAQ